MCSPSIMVCKEEIIVWFKELESYKRIDTMCTLLNMCLPFELRFLGTCLEELGRRDAQELRGVELRVNNPQEFAADIQSCYIGELTDIKVRRRMALYLALLRATFNRNCINDLFKALDQWGERDFAKFADGDPLQELLLVYTMATNHPIFTFEQRLKCGEILKKIKASKMVDVKQQQQSSPQQHQHQHPSSLTHGVGGSAYQQMTIPGYAALHNSSSSTPPPPQPQSNATGQPLPNTATGQSGIPNTFQMMAHNIYPAPLSQIISAENLQPHLTVESLPPLLQSNLIIPNDFSMPPPNALAWQIRPNFQPFQPMTMEGSFHQTASSPMLSQPSSPSQSRSTSPSKSVIGIRNESAVILNTSNASVGNNSNLNVTQGGRNASGTGTGQGRGSVRNSRRPSIDTTPPPQQSQIITMVDNDIVLPQSMKGFDDVTNVEGTINQIQLRNGYARPHTIPRHASNKPGGGYMQQQHGQQPNAQLTNNSFNPTGSAGLTYTFQNMNIIDIANLHHVPPPGLPHGAIHHHKSAGSDSGSSVGSGEISPPETPSLSTTSGGTSSNVSTSGGGTGNSGSNAGNNRGRGGTGMHRINGRSDKNQMNTSGSVIYASNLTQQQQQQSGSQQFGSGSDLSTTSSSNNNNNNNNSNASLISSSSQNNLQQMGVSVTSPSSTVILGGAGSNVLLQPHLQSASGTIPQFATATATAFPPYGQQAAAAAAALRGAQLLPHTGVPHTASAQAAFRHPAAAFAPLHTPNDTTQLVYISHFPLVSHPTPPPPSSNVRSSPSALGGTGTVVGGGVTSQQQQQQQQQPPQTIPVATAATTSALLQTPAAVTALPIHKASQSCFNCGSTAHSGRECQESSMEDVTRNSIYKLDYTTAVVANQQLPSIVASTTSAIATSSALTLGGNPNQSVTSSAVVSATTTQSSTTLTVTPNQTTDISGNSNVQQSTAPTPRIKPLFHKDLIQRAQPIVDEGEIISLISSDSSNESSPSSK